MTRQRIPPYEPAPTPRWLFWCVGGAVGACGAFLLAAETSWWIVLAVALMMMGDNLARSG